MTSEQETWKTAENVFLALTLLSLSLSLTAELGLNPFKYYVLYWSIALVSILGVFTSVSMKDYYAKSEEDLQENP